MAQTYERHWEVRRGGGRSAGDEARDSYYGVPVIHKPHWKWLIIVYFFLGGISGGSYVIAAIANLFGGRDGQRIARVGHFVSLAALIPSPLLLILDLGRPERFLHMLRVFKIRSPMSVGTWGLTAFGLFTTAGAAIEAVDAGLLRRPTILIRIIQALPARLIYVIGMIPGFFVSGYTGVLLAATAIPLWTKRYLMMGPLFVSSAMSTAAAAITLLQTLGRNTNYVALHRLERLERVTILSELALLIGLERSLGPTIARPLREGQTGQLHRIGVLGLGIGVPLGLHMSSALAGNHSPKRLASLASILTLIGGFIFRYVMVMGGHASADDPAATFAMTRADGKNRA